MTKEPLPAGPIGVSVRLAKDGTVVFEAGGKALPSIGKLPGALIDSPDEPLSVGRDTRSPVGDYPEGENAFAGTIEALHIQLAK